MDFWPLKKVRLGKACGARVRKNAADVADSRA
jgi:hypothetical protein